MALVGSLRRFRFWFENKACAWATIQSFFLILRLRLFSGLPAIRCGRRERRRHKNGRPIDLGCFTQASGSDAKLQQKYIVSSGINKKTCIPLHVDPPLFKWLVMMRF